jgi:hypothetical protein
MKFRRFKEIILIPLFTLSATVFGGQIDTFTNSSDSIRYFGPDAAPSFGDILTTNSNISLTDFTFYMRKEAYGSLINPFNFKAYVYLWDDNTSKTIGNALFSSDVLITPNSNSTTPVTVSTGNINLAANRKYALFFSTNDLTQGANSSQYALQATSSTNINTRAIYQQTGSQQNDAWINRLYDIGVDYAYIINYLDYWFPTTTDTQSSLTRLASRLRGSYNSASLISNYPNSATYDCNLFDVKGMCISAGGRYSTVDNPSSNSSAAVVTLGYKVSPNIRIGGFLDQSVNTHSPTGIDISNKHPMMGAFAYWNQNADGLGFQMKVANAYQDKDLSTIRDVIGTSEAGRGNTSLNTRSYVSELSYAFMYKENTLVRPYFALRYTTIEQDAYTETGVTTPLTYSALNDRTTSVLMGVKFKHALTPKANLIGSLGVEQDLHNKTDRLTAIGIAGLTSENLSGDLHRTRPVASIGATYDIAKSQRLSGEVLVQQLPFQSTAGATAYFNYMIGF